MTHLARILGRADVRVTDGDHIVGRRPETAPSAETTRRRRQRVRLLLTKRELDLLREADDFDKALAAIRRHP